MPSAARMLPVVAGFVLVGGLLPVGIVAVFMQPPQPLPWTTEATEAPAEAPELQRVYVELEDPLMVSLGPDAGTMQARLAVVVEGVPLDLLELQAKVEAQTATLNAAMLAEAQTLVTSGAKSLDMHAALPERLRSVINGIIGTESWPEPVEEVMLIELVMQHDGMEVAAPEG